MFMMIIFTQSIFKSVNYNTRLLHNGLPSNNKWNIIFFGTDKFSISSLEQVYKKHVSENVINKLEVVTNLKNQKNDVLKFALKHNLPVHPWPLQSLQGNKFDIGIVVSFGHLIPESVITMFPLGILNVHASLLPKWRGATPIVHSLMNGDDKTGVTIMRIHPKHFDVGEIVSQKEIPVRDDILQPELHNKLANLGAEALLECINTLPECLDNAKPQNDTHVTYAPRFTKSLGIVKWSEKTAKQIYNLSRALCGIHPLQTRFKNHLVKLNAVHLWRNETNDSLDTMLPGHFKYIKRKNIIRVWCADGSSIYIDSISLPGKKMMSALDFKNGFLKHIREDDFYFTSDNIILEKEIVQNKQ